MDDISEAMLFLDLCLAAYIMISHYIHSKCLNTTCIIAIC